MRAMVLQDDGFPTTYIKSGVVKLNAVPSDMDFAYLLIADWNHYQDVPEHFKWMARIKDWTIKPGAKQAELRLEGYWRLDKSQREFLAKIKLSRGGFKFYAVMEEDIWQQLGMNELKVSEEPLDFLSLSEATARLASSYGVPESAIKISISN